MIPSINSKYVLIFFLPILVFLFFVFETSKPYSNPTLDYTRPYRRNTVYILYWESMWHYKDFTMGFGNEIFKNCPVNNCYTTNNRNLIPIEEYRALVFHGVQYQESYKRNPPKRDPKQIYIYFNLENIYNTPTHLRYSKGFFNWTLSYR